MTIANQQITNKPLLYVNNAQISWVTDTTLSIAVSQERDSTNAYDLSTSAATTINMATNGLNGLDTGSIAASTWYYIFAIGDSLNYKTHGFIVSTSSTAPTLPLGYDAIKLIGYWRTDVSVHLIKGYTIGNGSQRTFFYDAQIEVLTAGTASTYAAVDLSGAVPPVTNTPVLFTVLWTPNAAEDYVDLRPTGSSATAVTSFSGVVAAKQQRGQMKVLSKIASSVAKIDYQNSAASGATTLRVLAFDYYL